MSPLAATVGKPAVSVIKLAGVALSKQKPTGLTPWPCVAAVTERPVTPVNVVVYPAAPVFPVQSKIPVIGL